MDLYVLIFGLCLCALTTAVFLHFRIKRGGVVGLLTKAIASFSFVIFALFLSATKTNVAYHGSYAITCLIAGLVAGLIGDILLDLKVMYPFHETKFLTGGMVSFSVAHIFNIIAILLFANNELVFSNLLLPLVLIFVCCLILTLLIWVLSVKVLKFNFKKHTCLVNIYTFALLLTTTLACYFSFAGLTIPMIILAIGFVVFLASNLILSKQYFGGKQDSKTLTFANHLCYYVAQIVIAMFIFFV